MNTPSLPTLSVVVPVYNEAAGIEQFHAQLMAVLKAAALACEVIYVDDGSLDASAAIIRQFAKRDRQVRLLKFSRNFGKEIALTAGIHTARGAAIIMLDADGQYPVDLLPQFITAWQAGAKVVVGVRRARKVSASLTNGLAHGCFTARSAG